MLGPVSNSKQPVPTPRTIAAVGTSESVRARGQRNRIQQKRRDDELRVSVCECLSVILEAVGAQHCARTQQDGKVKRGRMLRRLTTPGHPPDRCNRGDEQGDVDRNPQKLFRAIDAERNGQRCGDDPRRKDILRVLIGRDLWRSICYFFRKPPTRLAVEIDRRIDHRQPPITAPEQQRLQNQAIIE